MSFFKLAGRLFVFAAICSLALTGCAGTGAGGGDESKSGGGEKAPVEKEGTPIIEYDGGMITAEEIKILLDKMPPQERAQYEGAQGLQHLVKTIAEHSVLAEVARDKGIDDKEEVRIMMEIFTNLRLSQEFFQNELKPMMDNPVVTEEEMQKYYEENKSQFDKSKVKAAHILVKEEEKANEIYEQVKADPEKFAQIAEEESLDTGSAKNGGDLGWFGRGMMVPEFEQVAFSLEPGEISEPVKSMFGWHIIQLEEKTETGMKTYEEAKQQIKGILSRDQGRGAVQAKIEEFKANKNLVIHDENLALITGGDQQQPPAGGTPPTPAGSQAQPERTPPPPPDTAESE